MSEDRVTVPLGSRSYDIHIGAGLVQSAGREIRPFLSRPRVAVLSDEAVVAAHWQLLEQALEGEGIESTLHVVPAGETSKSWATLEASVEWLLEEQIARDDVLVAFGGGVVGDLGGFVAAIALRGIDFIQIPTTLLAQVDSSVGGKTGINSPRGKNLVGAFHQPKLVLADIALLDTLPQRDLLAGYAEVAKYGLLGDAGFFTWLEENGAALLAGDRAARVTAVRRSCEIKAEIVCRDELEAGDRALLNLGHTFGHALEAATGYGGRLLHGEAVSIGCTLAFQLSAELGFCAQETPSRVAAHFDKLGLRHRIDQIPGSLPDASRLIELMGQDKKVRDGRIGFVVARDVGEAFVSHDIDPDAVQHFLEAALVHGAT